LAWKASALSIILMYIDEFHLGLPSLTNI